MNLCIWISFPLDVFSPALRSQAVDYHHHRGFLGEQPADRLLWLGFGVRCRSGTRNSSFADSSVLSFTFDFPLGALQMRVVIRPTPTQEPRSWGSGSAVLKQRSPQGTFSPVVTAQSVASGAWGAAQKGFGSAKPKALANCDVGVETSEMKAKPMLVSSRSVCWHRVIVSYSQEGDMFS